MGKLLGNKVNSEEKFNLLQYFKESREELKKVAWPSKEATWKNAWVVIGFTVVFVLFLGVMDYGFNYALEWFLNI